MNFRLRACGAFLFFAAAAGAQDRDAGDFLTYDGKKIPVLRRSGKIVAFLKSGAEEFPESRSWRPRSGRDFSTRNKILRRDRRPAQLIDAAAFKAAPVSDGDLDSLTRLENNVAFTRPVYYDPSGRSEFTVSDRVNVKWREAPSPSQVDAWAAARGFKRGGQIDGRTFILELADPRRDPMVEAARLGLEPGLEWAEPEMLFQIQKHFLPNDSLFSTQRNLRNTAQNGVGTVGADVRADSAWDVTQGDSAITIAILDDGVDTAHPDLRANIRAGGRNYSGVGSFTDPRPIDADDNHGTAVAGVAAARGNNTIGVSGAAPKVKILPIKLSSGTTWATNTSITQAIRWAADTLNVDVLSNSWGLAPFSSAVRDAIRDASTLGRGGKGALVFFSAGNNGSGFKNELNGTLYSIPVVGGPVAAGSHRVGFRYKKNGSTVAGEDRVCLDNLGTSHSVILEPFASGIPSGWDAGSSTQGWQQNTTLYYSGTGDQSSVCSGAIGNSQTSELRLPAVNYPAGVDIFFLLRRSSHSGDVLQVRFYNAAGTTLLDSVDIPGGIDASTDTLSFPASADSALAVGSSSEYDFRTGYSQYTVTGSAKTVDFLAPSDGAWVGVSTTDRTGSSGYGSGNYIQTFGGTSAACPLAAGVGALLLSQHPAYTRNQALDALRRGCDKIGGVAYSGGYAGGTHREYGYGRLNALKALQAVDQAPTLNALNDTSVNENEALQLTLSGSDPDGDPVTFSIVNALSGDTLNGSTFTWTPGFSDSGTFSLRFVAQDPAGLSDTDTVSVHVSNVDRPPAFQDPGPISMNETQTLNLPLSATDPDGDAVAYARWTPPSMGSLSGNLFTWATGYGDSGSYAPRFVATANGLSDTLILSLHVANVDRPPVLQPPPDTAIYETQALALAATASDPDGDAITWQARFLPTGAVFNSGNLGWTPAFSDSGLYAVRYIALSGALADSADAFIYVANLDRPPVLAFIPDTVINEGQAWVVHVTATDVDGDSVGYAAAGALPGASFANQNLSWTPGYGDSGSYRVRFYAYSPAADSLVLVDSQDVAIRVNNVDRPPVITALPDTAVNENQLLQLTLQAADPDGDAVTLSRLSPSLGAVGGNVFSWTPGYSDSGTYVFRFVAAAQGLSDTDTVSIRVANVDRPPVIQPLAPQSVLEADTLVFTVTAADPDGDAISLSALNPPSFGSLGGNAFTVAPGYADSGVYSLRFRATARGLSDTDSVSVQVLDAGTGLGTVRLVADSSITDFLAMGAGPGEGAGLGSDSVDVRQLQPGWYTFAARRAGHRTIHFAVQAVKDSLVTRRVSLKPSVPLRFAAPETLLVNGNPWPVPDSAVMAAGDVDYDGREDLVLFAPSGIHPLLNTDTAADRGLRFDSTTAVLFPGLNPRMRSAFFADWNYDGYLDLLGANAAGDVFIVPGSDSGFANRQTLLTRAGESLRPFTGDFDADGLPDLWVASTGLGVFVYRNAGTASNPVLGAPVELKSDAGTSLTGLQSTLPLDLNGDGVPDLVSHDNQNLHQSVLRFQSTYRDAAAPKLVNAGGKRLACSGCSITASIPASGFPRLFAAERNRPLTARNARLLGDLDGNGAVNASDRNLLLLHWDSREGDTDWMDGLNLWIEGSPERIDVKDFADMADSWGLSE